MPLSALTGTKLRDLRMALGLKQAEAAARAGISASYLNLIEHNRRKVTPEVMERLADALGIDRAALVGGKDAALVEDVVGDRAPQRQAEADSRHKPAEHDQRSATTAVVG